jgi:iron complex transport system permease protein
VSGAKRSRSLLATMALAGVLLAAIVLGSICVGSTGTIALRDVFAALQHAFEPVSSAADPQLQQIVLLRTWRALTAAGVGAGLALSGGLIQGLFRNGLASPSLLGVSGGAALGAALAILAIGGYGILERGFAPAALFVPLCSFIGALLTVSLVAFLASSGGRTSVPTLLLVGIAVNMCVAGAFAAIQSLTLKDFEVSRAILAWTFGTLEDRSAHHAAIVWSAVAIAAACLPFVSRELDLFRGGETDAAALGVRTGLVKLLVLSLAALTASAAVAVAGQIAFVGLAVPHLVRLIVGPGHSRLLPLCIVSGAIFLLGADLAQRILFGASALQPGVLMSLVGGPLFVLLLVRHRREVGAW